jgi:hypothetical protein
MPVDLPAAARFVAGHARLLDRHRHAALIEGGAKPPVLDALRAYRNDDGGFGHALEPDVRAPSSQPGATLYALETLAELDACDDRLAGDAAAWVARIAGGDGAVPAVVGDIDAWPHAPWWQPEAGTFLTAAFAGVLHECGVRTEWRDRATEWSWEHIRTDAVSEIYRWKSFVAFLDHAGDRDRAEAELERIREPVQELLAGDVDLTPLDYSPWPHLASRALFPPALIERELDALAAGQQEDGGWTFPWPAWSPGATLDWRGSVTVRALHVLRANGRL